MSHHGMAPDFKIAWVTIIVLAALALIMGLCAICHAEPLTLRERIISAQPMLASRSDVPVAADEFADAVLSVPRLSPDWAALLLTVAAHESALSARIARGECRPRECDHGLAWSLWQVHRNEQNSAVWGSRDLNVQAREASRMLRQAFYRCGGMHAGWLLQTLRAYAGKRCSDPFPGESARVATFVQVRSRL